MNFYSFGFFFSPSSLSSSKILFPQQTKNFTAELQAKPEYHKFLIGKGGGNIRKVRDSTGARIIFPTADDKDQELITVIGTEEAVQEAQKELEELIKSLVSLRTTTGWEGGRFSTTAKICSFTINRKM